MQPAKLVIQVLVFLTLISVFMQYNTVYSQDKTPPSLAVTGVPGPPMLCGEYGEISKIIAFFKEEEFMVLTDKQEVDKELYYTLYRNTTTGSWSLVAYNLEGVSSSIACLLGGGFKAFILPDSKGIDKMLKQQKKGFEEIKSRGLTS
mgnify:CR=1 FL=1